MRDTELRGISRPFSPDHGNFLAYGCELIKTSFNEPFNNTFHSVCRFDCLGELKISHV
jgi:hypothetical protein